MGKKQKKSQNGYLDVWFKNKAFSGTLIITSLQDESQIYYASRPSGSKEKF